MALRHNDCTGRLVVPDSECLEVVPEQDFAGLQVSPDTRHGELKETNKAIEGLEKAPPRLERDAGKEALISKHIPVNVPVTLSRRGKKLFIVVVVAILVITAAILGGIFGRKAASSSPGASTPPLNDTEQAKSSIGTWRGTGIASLCFSDFDEIQVKMNATMRCQCWFSDWQGEATALYFDFDNAAGNISSVFTRSAPIASGKASGFTSVEISGSKNSSQQLWRLVYVDVGGILSDVTISESSTQGGGLNQLDITVPTDRRTAVSYVPATFFNMSILFFAGTDGSINVYRQDQSSGSWSNSSVPPLEGAWAYGGLGAYATALNQTAREASDLYGLLSIFTSTQDGHIRGWKSKGPNDTSSQATPNWFGPRVANETTLVNTSMATGGTKVVSGDLTTNVGPLQLFFANSEGKLASYQSLVHEWYLSPAGFGQYTTLPENIPVMRGSDMSIVQAPDFNLIFYQDDGESLAWVALNNTDNRLQNSGRLVSNSTGVWHMVWDEKR